MVWAFSAAATSAGQLAISQAALEALKDLRRKFRLLSLMTAPYEADCLRYRVMPWGATLTAPYILPLGATTTPSPAPSSGTKASGMALEMLPIHTPFFQPG